MLRRSIIPKLEILILPGADRFKEEAERFRKYEIYINDVDPNNPFAIRLDTVIEGIKSAMGIKIKGKVFSLDMLRLKLFGLTQPPLILVDLPGFFKVKNKD